MFKANKSNKLQKQSHTEIKIKFQTQKTLQMNQS